jgi:two-component system sporulation sensor kinase B
MISHLKDFILNIFIIFSPLVFYPYVYKTKNNILLYRFLLYILFSIALVLTMSLPIKLNGLTYDFRSIPLVAGCLYGGPLVSVLLYFTLIIYRFIMGNPSNLIYAVSVLPSFLLTLYFYRKYISLKLPQKIALSIILCSVFKLITFSLYLQFTSQIEKLAYKPLETLETYLIQGFIIGVSVFLIEFLNKYFHMEEEVVKSEKVKIVSEMAASVAHEIRNPLTAVRGFIQLFGADNLDREKKSFYQKICLEELDRAQLIITDYLSLAKPDPEIIENISLKDEICYISNVLMTYANYNNIRIEGAVCDDRLPFIYGDRYKFRQALINIGKNAIEAMPNGGILEIKACKVEDNVVITIKDSGIGMTPKQIKRLGIPYYSSKEKGTGLGTTVSFNIIRKMNGKIEIKSEVNKGTEFKFIFPSADV